MYVCIYLEARKEMGIGIDLGGPEMGMCGMIK